MKQKLKSTFLFILLTIFFAPTFTGQTIDELQDPQYEKAKSIIDSCNFYFEKDDHKYSFYAQEFEKLDFDHMPDSNFRKVVHERTDFLRRKFEYDEALSILTQAISVAKNKRDTQSLAFFHKSLSTHYYHLDDLDCTSVQLERAYNFYEYLNDKAEMGILAIRKSIIAFHQGNYENAIKFSFHAIELHKAAGDQAKMAISYLQLGNTYLYLSNHIGAIKYFELAGILFKKTGNEYGNAQAISNTGLVEIKIKQYRSGIDKQFTALKYFIEEGYAIDAGESYNFLFSAYFGLQEYDSSLYYNELGRKEFEKSNYQEGIGKSYLNEAKVFFVYKAFKKAMESALKAYEIADETSNNRLLEDSNFELYRIYKKLNQDDKSFQHLEQYVTVKNNLNFNPYTLQSEAMKYQLAAEEAELNRQLAEERAQVQFEKGERIQQQLFYTFLIAVIILISLFVTIYYLLRNRKLNRNLSLQKAQLSEDLKVNESLLSEIHHRVKNNLQVINSMLSLQNQYVSDESLKSIIEDCKCRIISMSLIHESLYRKQDFKEAFFSNYIKELLPRLINTYGTDPHKTHLDLDIESVKLSLEDSLPCGLLINEIVSNSLKHAFVEGKEGHIRIELKQVKEEVKLTVEDDGIGLKEGESFKAEDSFGFLLIEILAGQLGAELTINTTNGFSYYLKWKNNAVKAEA